MTVQNEALKWAGTLLFKNLLSLIMKTSSFFNFFIISDNLKLKKMNTFFLFWLSFFANECYTHINLLNRFLSATLFLCSMLQYPFSLNAAATVLCSQKLRLRGAGLGLEMNKQSMFTTAQHTKIWHHPSQNHFFNDYCEETHRVPGLVGPRVLEFSQNFFLRSSV